MILSQVDTLTSRDVSQLASPLGITMASATNHIKGDTNIKIIKSLTMTFLDSGAGLYCLNSTQYAIAETQRRNTIAIATASAEISPSPYARLRYLCAAPAMQQLTYICMRL